MAAVAIAGHHHDPGAGGGMVGVGAEGADHFEARHARHGVVEQEKVGGLKFKLFGARRGRRWASSDLLHAHGAQD